MVEVISKALPISLSRIIELTDGQILPKKNEDTMLYAVSDIAVAKKGELTFFDNVKYKKWLPNCSASVCIITEKYAHMLPDKCIKVIVETPRVAFSLVVLEMYGKFLNDYNHSAVNIASTADIAVDAKLGADVVIGEKGVVCSGAVIGDGSKISSGAFVGKDVVIGKNCTIGVGVNIVHSRIGDDVIIHSGAQIGTDGFGFVFVDGAYKKLMHVGGVVIHDNVEIGSNTCIDRGSVNDTVIGAGTKIDNLVQIGHNVVIGRNCIIVGQNGIAGSAILEDGVVLGGQAAINGHVKVGKGTQVAARSVVVKDIAPYSKVGGFPARMLSSWKRDLLNNSQLSKRFRQIDYLKDTVGNLVSSLKKKNNKVAFSKDIRNNVVSSVNNQEEFDSADISSILANLPHRYPFLLVDKLCNIDKDQSCIGIKNVTINEQFFSGHFPQYPVMPGVLIIEGIAQTAGALCSIYHRGESEEAPPLVYFMTIDKVKFRKPVLPGDVLEYHVKQIAKKTNIWKYSGIAMVNGRKVAQAEVGAMMILQSD